MFFSNLSGALSLERVLTGLDPFFGYRATPGGQFKEQSIFCLSSYRTNNNVVSEDGDTDDGEIDWEKIEGDFDAAQKAKWEKCPPLKKDFYQEHPGKFISISVSFLFGHNEVLTCSSAKAMSIPNKPSCCCNSRMIHGASPRCFTLHYNFPTNKPLVQGDY